MFHLEYAEKSPKLETAGKIDKKVFVFFVCFFFFFFFCCCFFFFCLFFFFLT